MVHGKGQGRHQGEHLGLGLINQMEGKEAMGRLKRKTFVVNDRKSSTEHTKFEVPIRGPNGQEDT